MPTIISRPGILPSRGGETSGGRENDESRKLEEGLIQSRKEHPAMRSAAELAERYGPESRAMHLPKNKSSISETERTSSVHTGKIEQADRRLQSGFAGHQLLLLSLPSRGTAGRINPEIMISLKDTLRYTAGSEPSREPVPAILPSSNDFQSGSSGLDIASAGGKLEFSWPVYRMAPSISARETEERISITSSHNLPSAGSPLPFAPSAQELNRISEQVCSIIERKLQIERERRGIYG